MSCQTHFFPGGGSEVPFGGGPFGGGGGRGGGGGGGGGWGHVCPALNPAALSVGRIKCALFM